MKKAYPLFTWVRFILYPALFLRLIDSSSFK